MTEVLEYAYGIISLETYLKHKQLSGHDWIKSILVFAYPYPNEKVNGMYVPAKFAYGRDYHQVVIRKLEETAIELHLSRYEAMADVSYLDEKLCAYLSGLGTYGKNNLIISPKYGTSFVIGEIVTDSTDFNYTSPIADLCSGCDLCVRACPVHALDHGFDRSICLSYLSQSASDKYPLYGAMQLCFGCDLCQDVCPHNQKQYPFFKEFGFDEKSHLSLTHFRELNTKTYREYYQDKTFSWIGYLKMLRNLIVLEANAKRIGISEIEAFAEKYRHVSWFFHHMEYLKGKINNGI